VHPTRSHPQSRRSFSSSSEQSNFFGQRRGAAHQSSFEYKNLDDEVNPGEAATFIEQRLRSNPDIFIDPADEKDPEKINAYHDYAQAVLSRFLSYHREPANVLMDPRYDPQNGKFGGCPIFSVKVMDKIVTYLKTSQFINNLSYCLRQDPAMKKCETADDFFDASRKRKLLDLIYDTSKPSIFVEHLRNKLDEDPTFLGGLSDAANATLRTLAFSVDQTSSSSSSLAQKQPSPLRRSPRKTTPAAPDDNKDDDAEILLSKKLDFFCETPLITSHPKYHSLYEATYKKLDVMVLKGTRGLLAFAKSVYSLEVPTSTLKRNLVPVLTHLTVVDSLSSFIKQNLYDDVPELCLIKSPSKQALVPATTPAPKRPRSDNDDVDD
jgi:hypothetical protein